MLTEKEKEKIKAKINDLQEKIKELNARFDDRSIADIPSYLPEEILIEKIKKAQKEMGFWKKVLRTNWEILFWEAAIVMAKKDMEKLGAMLSDFSERIKGFNERLDLLREAFPDDQKN